MDSFQFEVTDGHNTVKRMFRIAVTDVDNKKPTMDVIDLPTINFKLCEICIIRHINNFTSFFFYKISLRWISTDNKDDETPRLTVNTGLEIENVGERKLISNQVLQAVDLDSHNPNIVFIIRRYVKIGESIFNSIPSITINSLTNTLGISSFRGKMVIWNVPSGEILIPSVHLKVN
jgi:hypothetical protein